MDNQISMDDQFLSKIHQIIEDNLADENFSVEDLAQHAGLSRSMLHRKLIKLAGRSAGDLITERRLLKAKELLENNVATASEIAYKVGFSSPSYFTKVFKNYFQVSPGNVRKGISINAPLVPDNRSSNTMRLAWNYLPRPGILMVMALLILALAGAGIYFVIRKNKPVEKSIAILPFDNLSLNEENRFFADGLVEDLLNRISKIEGLKVISRTSSEIFRDKGNKTIPEIGGLLGVSYILEGTVQREGNNVRINIQLIDASKDDHILSKQYDRKLSEIFQVQSEIAGEIANELSLVLTDQQNVALKQDQTTNLKALEFSQLGRYHLNKRTGDDLFTSVKYFRLAIEEDPDYALAYAEMADSYFILSWYRFIDKQLGRDSAIYLAKKALELDKNLGEAHTVLGVIYDQYDWKYDAAAKEFLKAIELKPSHATAYQYYSELLCTSGKNNEAREYLNKAIRLNPYSFVIRYASSLLYLKEEKFDQALAENQICQELVDDNVITHKIAFQIHMRMGNEPAALESFKKMVRLEDNWSGEQVDSVYRIGGIKELLRWRLNKGTIKRSNERALYYAMLGEDEKVLDILESALNNGLLEPFSTTALEFRNLRSNPRFIVIRKKMGLSPLPL
jgi:TolB-like protein/AraC-like DNA-binding protein